MKNRGAGRAMSNAKEQIAVASPIIKKLIITQEK